MINSRRALALISLTAAVLTASSIVPIHLMESDTVGGLVAFAAFGLLLCEGVLVLLRGGLRAVGRSYGARVRETAPSVGAYVLPVVAVVLLYWGVARSVLKSDFAFGDLAVSVGFPLMAVLRPMVAFIAVVCTAWLAILGITQIVRPRADRASATSS